MNRRGTIPWLIVSIIALVAVIVAIVVLGIARLSPTSDAGGSTVSAPGSANASDSSGEQPDANASASASTFGGTGVTTLTIDGWGIALGFPRALGYPSYTLSSSQITFDSALEQTLPSACSGLTGSWGVSRSKGTSADASARKVGAYSYAFVSPNETCPSATDTVARLTSLYRSAFESVAEAN